jgi:hypothetical protein
MHVPDQDAVVGNRAALNFEIGMGLDAGDLIGGDIAGELVFARQQSVHAACHLGHLHQPQRLDRRPSTPVFVVGVQRQHRVRHEFPHLVGAGADGFPRELHPARRLVEGPARHDLTAGLRKPPLKRRVDVADGIAVHDVDPVETGKQAP